jgi:hypothetical protein
VGYIAVDRFSQSRDTYRQSEPVREFLSQALAGDTLAIAEAADQQPIHWAMAAIRVDSLAVREWAVSRAHVRSSRRGDTVWVTLRRPGSTDRCSPLYPLTAGFVERNGQPRLVHLSSSCPSISRAEE